MVEINLLPWRQLQREYQQKMLKIIFLASALFACVVISVPYGVYAYQVDTLSEQVNLLQHQVEQLSSQQDNQHPYQETEKLENLQSHDATIKSLLILLGMSYEQEVCFTSISRNKNKLSFVGRTRSPTDLTNFLREWHAANLFADIQVDRLERDVKPNMFFHFQANLQSGT